MIVFSSRELHVGSRGQNISKQMIPKSRCLYVDIPIGLPFTASATGRPAHHLKVDPGMLEGFGGLWSVCRCFIIAHLVASWTLSVINVWK